MQMQLPIFPQTTKLINASVGFFEKDSFVYYLHNGSPIYCHDKNDLNSYRFIVANLITTNLCTATELSLALGVSNRNMQRYAKTLRVKSAKWFFNRPDKQYDAHKLTPEKLLEAQGLLDASIPVLSVAKQLGVTEGAIRYHIKQGSIKKRDVQ